MVKLYHFKKEIKIEHNIDFNGISPEYMKLCKKINIW
jgi:hypothetical protein